MRNRCSPRRGLPAWRTSTVSLGALLFSGLLAGGSRAATFTGDGRADYGIWRPSTGGWHVKRSDTLTSLPAVVFGAAGDVPLPSQMAQDARADQVLWRGSTGKWLVRSAEGTKQTPVAWGAWGDAPAAR